MSRDDATTKYIVEMRKNCDYMLNYAGAKKCQKSKDPYGRLNRCEGKLNDRPDWCPLLQVEKRTYDDQILYAECDK
jgi:hypothetical protein